MNIPVVFDVWGFDNFTPSRRIMEAPKELVDCYFFYYSTCRKGAQCPYRHEVMALGHERICQKWLQGNCFELHCPGRHMFIEKRRNNIPCYWENKPNGCLKPHCVFKHRTTRNHNNNIDLVENHLAGGKQLS